MLHLVKTTNLIIKRTPLLCGLSFTVVLVLLPISARAQKCAKWDASGSWNIVQGNPTFYIPVELEQKGRVLTGRATQGVIGKTGGVYNQTIGTVDGTIDVDSFSVQIFWFNGQTGVYNAMILPSGRLDGEGYEKSSSNVRVPWHSEGVLKCALAGPSKPFKITSKITLPPSTPSPSPPRPAEPAPPPPPMKVPGIVASPVIFQAPFLPTGIVILTWDGGPDHPYAEVWVKVNGAPETFVVEQGKGTRPETVQRGRNYEYILTDAGKTLATVVFYVPPY